MMPFCSLPATRDGVGASWLGRASSPAADRAVEARLNLGLVQLERLTAAEMRAAAENAVP